MVCPSIGFPMLASTKTGFAFGVCLVTRKNATNCRAVLSCCPRSEVRSPSCVVTKAIGKCTPRTRRSEWTEPCKSNNIKTGMSGNIRGSTLNYIRDAISAPRPFRGLLLCDFNIPFRDGSINSNHRKWLRCATLDRTRILGLLLFYDDDSAPVVASNPFDHNSVSGGGSRT